jgi:hypothetical protein
VPPRSSADPVPCCHTTTPAWLQRLIDRELAAQLATQAAPSAALALPNGEPCPGVVCAGHGCWNRDTARYGLRRQVLCHACAAALQGKTYQRARDADKIECLLQARE